MDALMAKMGPDGRGFVMLLMGFGCNVPALMGTRGDALALVAPAHHDGHPVLAVLGAPAGVRIHHCRTVFSQDGTGSAVQSVPVQLRGRHTYCFAVQKELSGTMNRSCWNCLPIAFQRHGR